MPIFLRPDEWRVGGPDGKGWNRISLGWKGSPECALRPRSWGTLLERTTSTTRARYGNYGPCVRPDSGGKACDDCPIWNAPRRELHVFADVDRVLVRLLPPRTRHAGQPVVVNHPEKGFASLCWEWTWEELGRLEGWKVGPRHFDEHGEGFWLVREPITAAS
jgi:hypothetical protein